MSGQETAVCGELYYSNTVKYKCIDCIKKESIQLYDTLHTILCVANRNDSNAMDDIIKLAERGLGGEEKYNGSDKPI
jgi:hypothetical protein